MSPEDRTEEGEYQPRPNDFLVEPLFAPFEKEEQPKPAAPSMLGRLLTWLLGK
jgi:hypothetical protein